MAIITVTSESFIDGGIIPANFKTLAAPCAEANDSPQLEWLISGTTLPSGVDPAICVDYYIIKCQDTDEIVDLGGPNEHNFFHWGVGYIKGTQTNIPVNGSFISADVPPSPSPLFTALTDYLNGQDKANGWQGPCTQGANIHTYKIVVTAFINKDWLQYFDLGDGNKIISDPIYFTDALDNIEPPPIEDCGINLCPSNAILVGDNCIIEHTTGVTVKPCTTIIVGVNYGGSSQTLNANTGIKGTRFYPNIDAYTLPLKPTAGTFEILPAPDTTNSILVDDDGNGVALTPVFVTTGELWQVGGDFPYNKGRLSGSMIWGDEENLAQDMLPLEEWIGEAFCFDVPVTKTYCLGFGAHDMVRITINGERIINFDRDVCNQSFTIWHVVELTLQQGQNIISVEGKNYGMDAWPPYGGVWDGVEAGFGFELYDATSSELQAMTTDAEMTAFIAAGKLPVSSIDYHVFNPNDMCFNLGEESAMSCPDGYSLNVCDPDNPTCSFLEYVDPVDLPCCYEVENCMDPNETYFILLDPTEPTILYIDNVYTFSPYTPFVNKCFKVIGDGVCETVDYENVFVQAAHGRDCSSCTIVHSFEKCFSGTPPEILTFGEVIGNPVVGNVYNIQGTDPCVIYLGFEIGGVPQFETTTITEDHNSTVCESCYTCYTFHKCFNETAEITIYLSGSIHPTIDDIGNTYDLDSHSIPLGGCWTLISIQPCTEGAESGFIEEDLECDNCSICLDYYEVTECGNAENNFFMYFLDKSPLDESLTYIFDFAGNFCYNVALQPPTCSEDSYDIYTVANITTTYADCDECNAMCYKITICETGIIIYSNTNLSGYVGSIVVFNLYGVPTCGLVEEALCRDIQSPIIIQPTGCVETCEDCLPTTPKECVYPVRKIQPGYDVPPCAPPGNTCCPPTDCDTNCNN